MACKGSLLKNHHETKLLWTLRETATRAAGQELGVHIPVSGWVEATADTYAKKARLRIGYVVFRFVDWVACVMQFAPVAAPTHSYLRCNYINHVQACDCGARDACLAKWWACSVFVCCQDINECPHWERPDYGKIRAENWVVSQSRFRRACW